MSAPQTEMLCAPNETLLFTLTFQPTRENTERRREKDEFTDQGRVANERTRAIAKKERAQETMRQDCMLAPKFSPHYEDQDCPAHTGVILSLVF